MKPDVGQKSNGTLLVLKSTKKLLYHGKRPKFKARSPKRLKQQSSVWKCHRRICNGNTRVKSKELTRARDLSKDKAILLKDDTISRFLDVHELETTADLAHVDRASDYSSLGTNNLVENLDTLDLNDATSLSDSVRSSHFLSSLGTHSLNSGGLFGSFDISQYVIAAQLDNEERCAEPESYGGQSSSISEFEGNQVELNGETAGPFLTSPQRLATCEENNNNGSYDSACSPKGQHWLLNNNQKDYGSYNPLESRSSGLPLNACSSVEPSESNGSSENLILSCDESRGSHTGFPVSNPGGTLGSVSQILPRCSSPRPEAFSELNVDDARRGFSPPTSCRHEFLSDFESLASCFSEPPFEDWAKSQENPPDLLETAQLLDSQSYPSCGKSPTDGHFSLYRTSQNTELLSEEVNGIQDSLISQELNVVSLPCLSQETGTRQQASKTLGSQNQQFVNAQGFVDLSDQAHLTGQQASSVNIPTGQQASSVNIPTGQQASPVNIPTGQQASPFIIPTGQQPSPVIIPTGQQPSPVIIPTGWHTSSFNISTESDNLNSLEELLDFLPLEELIDILREASSVGDLAPLPETRYEAQAVGFLRQESTLHHISGEAQTRSGPAPVEDQSHSPTLRSDQMREIEEPHPLVVERSRDESAWNDLMPIPLPALPLRRGEQESGQVQDDDVDLSQLNLGPLPPALLGFPLPDDVDVHDTDIDIQMMRRSRHRN